jgi:peptidyl-prolyl cis-trans isomerase B (cyclophilin B)
MKPYDPLRPVGGLRHKPRGWFNRFMHNPWVLAAAMGVIAFGTILGLYLQQTGAGNRSTAASSPASQAVDQTLATPTATATATGTAGPQRVFGAAPQMAIDPSKQYTATIKTDKGDIVVNLFAKDAPQTVNSFVFLAQQGFYNGLTFDRVVKDFVIQGGDPKGDGSGGPGYTVPDEINAHKNDAGALAMANAGPGTDGSQFYIDLTAQPNLDGRYTVFGQVVSGLDVVQAIGQTPHTPGDPAPAITIDSVSVSPS